MEPAIVRKSDGRYFSGIHDEACSPKFSCSSLSSLAFFGSPVRRRDDESAHCGSGFHANRGLRSFGRSSLKSILRCPWRDGSNSSRAAHRWASRALCGLGFSPDSDFGADCGPAGCTHHRPREPVADMTAADLRTVARHDQLMTVAGLCFLMAPGTRLWHPGIYPCIGCRCSCS